MQKNTGRTTATTYTLADQHPNFDPMDTELRAELSRPYTWKDEAGARKAVDTMVNVNEFEHTVHTAPGLEVHAFYVNGAMLTVIAFEDDAAARLHRAVRREQPVTVTYVKADGEETVRTIEPTRLSLTKAGDVIVKAMDRKSDEARSFRLDRVTAYTVHRTRRTVRTEPKAPSKAELVAAFQAHAAGHVVVADNLTGEPTWYPRSEYDALMGARDPREPKAVDEVWCTSVTDVYLTDPETAAAMEAPEEVQNVIAERYALGHQFAFVTV